MNEQQIKNMNNIMDLLLFVNTLNSLYNKIINIIPVIPILKRQNALIIENKCHLCQLDNVFNDKLCVKCILKANNKRLIYNNFLKNDFIDYYHNYIEELRNNIQNLFEQYPNVIEINISYYNYLFLFYDVFNTNYNLFYDLFTNSNIIIKQ